MCGFFKKGIGKIIAQVAPIAAAFIPGVGPLASAAIAAGASKLTGGSWGDALKAGAMSGLGSVAGSAFKSAFPETAASLGFGSSSGLSQGMANGATTSSGSGLSSLIGSSGDAVTLPGIGQVSMNNGSGLTRFANNMASGVSKAVSDIPIVGNVLDKSLSWASNNPIPAALAAGSLYSGYTSQQAQKKQQEERDAAQKAQDAQNLSDWRYTLGSSPLNRPARSTAGIDYAHYGEGPEFQYFDNNQLLTPQQQAQGMAKGGKVVSPFKGRGYNTVGTGVDRFDNDMITMAAGGGVDPLKSLGNRVNKLKQPGSFKQKIGKVKGPGAGMDDKVKAMLSDGEYVFPADVVAHLGDGSNDAGAKALDQMITHIRKVKTGKTSQPAAFGAA